MTNGASPQVQPQPPDSWLRALRPQPLGIDRTERARIVAGGFIGILATAMLCHGLAMPPGLGWIIAPMGASAVLVFGLPASPLAQPWAVVAGNTVSALAGIACARLIPIPDLAAAAAVGLAITAMLALRSLHPPGGATALLMALTGTVDPSAALFPVFTNSLLLTAAGVAYNNLTRRSYPHPAPAVHARRATEEDLDAVLSRYNQILDIDRDDLRALVDGTQLLTHQRRLADTRCSDLLTREVATASIGTTLEEAWALLRAQDIKTLPVVDRAHHVVGIVTLTDFLDAAGFEVHAGLGARLRSLVRVRAGRTGRVGDIMTRKVRVTREHRSLADLVLLFGSTRHRQIPVVDPDGKLVGMITQTDVVSALKDAEAGNSGPRA